MTFCDRRTTTRPSPKRALSRYYEQYEKTPGAQALQDAIGVLEGKALFDGTEHPVFVRLAACGNSIFLDLCNDQWQAIEIDARRL